MVDTKNGEVNWFTMSKAMSILSQEWDHWHGRERVRERERYERNPLDNEQIKVRLQTKSIKMNKTYNFNEPN